MLKAAATDRLTAALGHRPVTRGLATIFVVLLLIDVLLLVVNVIVRIAVGNDIPSLLSVSEDASLGEWFGYLKLGAAAAVLLMVWRLTRQAVYVVLAVILATIVLDDALQLHEHAGEAIAGVLTLSGGAGLRSLDVGELTAWAIAALALGIPLVLTYLRSTRETRKYVQLVAYGLAVLVVFAVGVDMARYLFVSGSAAVNLAMGALESLGELASMTLLVVMTLFIYDAVRPRAEDRNAVADHE